MGILLVGFCVLGALVAFGAMFVWDSYSLGLLVVSLALIVTGGTVVPDEAGVWVATPGMALMAGVVVGHGVHWVWRKARPDYARFQDERRAARRKLLRDHDWNSQSERS